MGRHKKWIAGVAALAALVLGLLRWWGGADARPGAEDGASEGGTEALAAPTVAGEEGGELARSRGGEADGGTPSADRGPAEWLPTATVSADPSSRFGTLSGRVISSTTDRGIAGAELVFERDGSTHSVRSASDGSFALVASGEGRHVLAIATAEGYLPFAPEWGHSPITFFAHGAERVDGVVVRLTPTTEIVVEVANEEQRPIPGATVRLLGAGAGVRAMAPLRDEYTTDGEGQARIQAFEFSLVEASHPEHGRGRAALFRLEDDEHVRIVLSEASEPSPSATIAGLVLDERRQPVEGAVVRAYRQRHGMHPSGHTASDGDGRFRLSGLDRGEHRVVATHPAHPDALAVSVMTGREDVVLQLSSGHVLRGRVIDEDGQPVPAFSVIARQVEGAFRRRTVGSVASYDADGRFVLTGLPEGPAELIATSRGFPPSAPVEVSVGSRASAGEVTLALRRGGRFEGIVQSSTDQGPVAGAVVSLTGQLSGSEAAAPSLARTVTDEAGRFVLDGVGGEPRSLRVSAEGHHTRLLSGLTAQAATGTVELTITLEATEPGAEPRTDLVGIGVNVFPRGDDLVIGRVIAGGGAEAAGLRSGDRIVAVDGAPVTSLGFQGSLERIRGAEGTQVTLSLLRREAEEPVSVTILRRRIRT